MNFTRTYTHPRLGEEVEAISGYYVPEREERMEIGDREVLYVVGYAVVDSSCCGMGGCGYAMVAGYVVRWRHATDADGFTISEVEPVGNEVEINEIKKVIFERENVNQVNFL